MTQPMTDGRMYSRMMAEHFGISILESDARLMHERITMLISEAYTRGVKAEREACARLCDDSVEYAGSELARQIRARGNHESS